MKKGFRMDNACLFLGREQHTHSFSSSKISHFIDDLLADFVRLGC